MTTLHLRARVPASGRLVCASDCLSQCFSAISFGILNAICHRASQSFPRCDQSE